MQRIADLPHPCKKHGRYFCAAAVWHSECCSQFVSSPWSTSVSVILLAAELCND